MAGIKHTYVSAVADDGDPDEVGPSEWNAVHTVEEFDAAGDLLQGTGSDTYARLARGTSLLDRLVVSGTSLAWVPHIAVKTADEVVNNSNTLQDDDHLKWTVAANEVWLFELYLFYTVANAASDFKMGWTVPSGTTMLWNPYVYVTDVTKDTRWPATGTATQTVLGEGDTAISGAGTNNQQYRATGIVRVSSTGGTLQMQWAQNTAHASDSTLRKDSALILWRTA